MYLRGLTLDRPYDPFSYFAILVLDSVYLGQPGGILSDEVLILKYLEQCALRHATSPQRNVHRHL